MQANPNIPLADPLKTGKWNHGLCGCFDNLGVCIITYFVPCVTFGQTREYLHNGEGCLLYGILYFIPFLNCYLEAQQRGEIRERRGIPGGCCGDLMLICCCPLCTLVQEAQEAKELLVDEARLSANTAATTVVVTAPVAGYGATAQQQYPAAGQQYPPAAPPPQYSEKGQAMARY